ncbi:hypothetical protein [Saccharospirillum mangrovi]|uniref:hypothetical protein n=1 Tax=Saccharospirillum mangrovi TaxID=2161747 RepID=UPI000D374AF2|nr:hypothetical protein [Saccharospirillum mangrovi]
MPHPISLLGAIHTLISLVPLIVGAYAFARYAQIDPSKRSGQIYLAGTALAVITAFGVSSTGGINPGHIFGIVVLVIALGGAWASKLNFLGRSRPYLSTFALSFSYLLSLVPGTNETLTRLPVSHPLADGPTSPVVQMTLLAWLVVFVVGFTLQCWLIRSRNKAMAAG